MINTFMTNAFSGRLVCWRQIAASGLLLCCVALTCSCTARTPKNLGSVQVGTGGGAGDGTTRGTTETMTTRVPGAGGMPPVANQFGERYDPEIEQAVGERSVAAWRIAVAHSTKPAEQSDAEWKKQRATDEHKAMDELGKLAKEFPSSSTVRFMQGQVEEHFGKDESAAHFFKQAGQNNRVNTMYMFKIAESERKTGKTKEAIQDYRRLLDSDKTFEPAKTGLAASLLKEDPTSAEARTLIEEVLANNPTNKDAKQLESEIKSDKKSK